METKDLKERAILKKMRSTKWKLEQYQRIFLAALDVLYNGNGVVNIKEYWILVEILCENKKSKEVADCHDLTNERVRQIFAKAITKVISNIEKINDSLIHYEKLIAENRTLRVENIYLKEKFDFAISSKTKDNLPLLSEKIENLSLSTRSKNCLKAARIETLAGLVVLTRSELLKFRCFGNKSLSEIEAFLESRGLSLGRLF